MHMEELQSEDVRCETNETLLWRYHTERFAHWIKQKVNSLIFSCSKEFIFVEAHSCS